MPSDNDKKDPPKPKYDPHEKADKKGKKATSDCEYKDTSKKIDSKAVPAQDPCEKYYPKGLDEVFGSKAKPKKTTPGATDSKKTSGATKSKIPTPICASTKSKTPLKKVDAPIKSKLPGAGLAKKIKLPNIKLPKLPVLADKIKLPTGLVSNLKDMVPPINVKGLKNIEYGNLIKYTFCKLRIWVRDNCNPKKMADKGSGPPARPMKYPYTFSAKFAQFPVGHYVKNQWIWKYYVLGVAVCLPVFYSINKLANSPGNVAKWAEIRRKEAAEHHH